MEFPQALFGRLVICLTSPPREIMHILIITTNYFSERNAASEIREGPGMDKIGRRILIAGNNIAMGMRVRSLLEELGFGSGNIHEAGDGEEGLAMAGKFEYALIISDWDMPVMNGLALLKALRAEEKTGKRRRAPFLMITGDSDRLRVGEAVRAGATAFLPRVFTPSDFAEKLKTIFRGAAGDPDIRWERLSRPVRSDFTI